MERAVTSRDTHDTGGHERERELIRLVLENHERGFILDADLIAELREAVRRHSEQDAR